MEVNSKTAKVLIAMWPPHESMCIKFGYSKSPALLCHARTFKKSIL